ncbi:MAG: HNH endonuclease signature motif containing protein, partial [Actinomycetota bacterium]
GYTPDAPRGTRVMHAEGSVYAYDAGVFQPFKDIGDPVEAGEVTIAHVDVLARAVGDRRGEHAARDEGALLDAARTKSLPEWERTLAGWRQHCDRELAADDTEAIWNGRHLHVRHDLFGTGHVRGQLDPDGAAALSSALAAHRSDPDPVGGPPRTIGQRNADALVSLATADAPVSVTVVVDHDLADDDDDGPVALRCDVDGAPIPAVTAERLSCGAARSVVTRRGRSILDVSEATPTVTVGQRRALLVRDPTCRFPGCAVAAHRCDVHHLRHQADGGEHRLDNLVHLCRHHHRFLHEHRWQTRGDPNGELTFHPPPGRDGS